MGKRNADASLSNGSPAKRGKFVADESLNESIGSNGSDFVLTKELVVGTILTDLNQKQWRVGKPIGKGSFGEIFLASDETGRAVHSETAKYVVKIEPHSNGPLFVEIHCLLNVGKSIDDRPQPPGMPEYIASGSHYFKSSKYRFLILPRYKCDLNALTKDSVIDPKNLQVIAVQVLDVLEHLHDKGYAHSDIKAENLMIGCCTYVQDDSVTNNDGSCWQNGVGIKNDVISDEENDSDDESSAASFKTPHRRRTNGKAIKSVQFSGSNPVRSCRMSHKNSIYHDMLSSHYLRPSKKVNYRDSDGSGDEKDDTAKDKNFIMYSHTTPTIAVQQTPPMHQRSSLKKTIKVTEDRIFLIDFGLAIKFIDSKGVHRPFCMDQRRAHDGTIEFTSRDAHMGAHSRRSDLECLGYNLIYWSQGSLPWRNEKLMQQPEQVHHMKEYFMDDIEIMFQHCFGVAIPPYIGEYMKYVAGLAYHDRPDYAYCRRLFTTELRRLCGGARAAKSLQLDVAELTKKRTRPVTPKVRDIKSMIRVGLLTTITNKDGGGGDDGNRISPKNLRSKSGKSKKQRSKFSWTDILSTNPDQIARQRAEKEYDREMVETPPAPFRYKGNPTYAILEVENRIKFRDKLENSNGCDGLKSEEQSQVITAVAETVAMCPAAKQYSHHNHHQHHQHQRDDDITMVAKSNHRPTKNNGYHRLSPGKSIMTMARKKTNSNHKTGSSGESSDRQTSSSSSSAASSSTSSNKARRLSQQQQQHQQQQQRRRRKSVVRTRGKLGLRKYVRPTAKSIGYRNSIVRKRRRACHVDYDYGGGGGDDDCVSADDPNDPDTIISDGNKGLVSKVNKNNCNLFVFVRVNRNNIAMRCE